MLSWLVSVVFFFSVFEMVCNYFIEWWWWCFEGFEPYCCVWEGKSGAKLAMVDSNPVFTCFLEFVGFLCLRRSFSFTGYP